jgi:tricorn protease
MLRPTALSVALALAAMPLAAQRDASWMRYPALSPDGSTIAFVYKGDLYRVPAAGGTATLLTTHPAQEWWPVWSPDGTQLVFTSDRYGNPDLFVIPATGGEARRLTFHRATEMPYAFTPDGKEVLFGAARQDPASSRLHPTTEMLELYRIPVAGGRPIQMLATPTEEVSVSRDGPRLLYMDRRGRENYWRKHHTSAAARDIWLYDHATKTHRQLTTFAGEDRNPVFLPGDSTFAYLSEASGTFNVHRWSLASGTSTQLTRFTGAPVRFLTAARNGTLAFGHDGQLYTMAPGGTPQRVAVTIATDAKANAERVIPISSGISQVAVSPNGKEIAFVFRGDVFAASVDGGVTTQITRTPWAEQGPTFAPDGNAIAYASERDGRWAIYEARRARANEPYFFTATSLTETALVSNDKQNDGPIYSPDGKSLAFTEDRTTLKVLTLATKQVKALLDQRHVWSTGGGIAVEWSPDSRYLLFGLDVPGLAPGEVGLVRADGSEPVRNLTQSGFDDRRPRWIHGGKAMLWMSTRDGLKALAQTGGSQADAYAMYFTQDAWDRARLTKDELALVKEAEEKAEKAKPKGDTTKAAVVPVVLDLDRASDRKQRLTIHSSALSDALLSKDGETLYYLARFERGLNLWSTSLRTRETKMVLALNASSGSMQWDAEQKKIFLVADGGVSTIDPASAKRESISIRSEMIVDQLAERQVAFDQMYRRVRDAFYTKGWHGADWEALRTQYARYVPHIGTSHEFAEMLSEMLGELNVSHSGANYRPSSPTDDATASLGVLVDPTWAGAGMPIVEVLRGGPMDRAGMDVKAGAVIEAIDGETLDATRDLAQLLNRKADRNMLVRLREGATTRELVVKAVGAGEESRLLYDRWVRRNAEEVDRLSNGRLGYIHVPGMNDGAYRTAFEEVMGKYPNRDGLVVDTRWNGGGDLVADLEMFLTGRRFFDYTTDTRSTGFEPNFRWTKPSIALANAYNYSDGHCFAWVYQTHKIGTLVGDDVPGTCTFAGGGGTVEGVSYGVPGMGVKDTNTGRYLENWPTAPDLRVANDPVSVVAGRDLQLEAAVKTLLGQLK